MSNNARRNRLIHPSLQLKVIAWILGVGVIALLMQFYLVRIGMTDLAQELPNDAGLVLDGMLERSVLAFFLSLLVLVPFSLFVGIVATFRIAGPLHRFSEHFKAIQRGEDPGQCRIRPDDELHDLCADMNAALSALRARGVAEAAGANEKLERAA